MEDLISTFDFGTEIKLMDIIKIIKIHKLDNQIQKKIFNFNHF